MAFFGVTIETIEKVWDHSNADRLSLAKVKGMMFQFVIGKNQYQVGDKVLYFPIDSVLPDELIEKMGMTGKFSGSKHNRIRTVSLRNEISQGFVIDPAKLLTPEQMNLSTEELTSLLGVVKYEPPVVMLSSGNLIPLPDSLSVYDIEGADRNQNIIDMFMDREVVIHEKMEGTNFSITKQDNQIFVNQRNYSIQEIDGHEHYFWVMARQSGLIDYLKSLNENNITIYAELCGPGIQGNMYGLKNQKIYIFDVKKNGRYLDFDEYSKFVESLPKNIFVDIAPLLFKGKLKDFLGGKTIQELSDGFSAILSTILREGIVIKLLIEENIYGYGRSIIKQRGPKYLSKSDN